jgi:hypothetical protein
LLFNLSALYIVRSIRHGTRFNPIRCQHTHKRVCAPRDESIYSPLDIYIDRKGGTYYQQTCVFRFIRHSWYWTINHRTEATNYHHHPPYTINTSCVKNNRSSTRLIPLLILNQSGFWLFIRLFQICALGNSRIFVMTGILIGKKQITNVWDSHYKGGSRLNNMAITCIRMVWQDTRSNYKWF